MTVHCGVGVVLACSASVYPFVGGYPGFGGSVFSVSFLGVSGVFCFFFFTVGLSFLLRDRKSVV